MDEILYWLNNNSVMKFFPNMGITDIIEIIILTIVIYNAIKSLKGTRAWVLCKGIAMLLGFYIFSYAFNFNVIVSLFQSALLFLGVAIVVTIQPELRRLIERLGRKNINITLKSVLGTIFKYNNVGSTQEKLISDNVIQEIVKGCALMGKAKTGVLIVIERDIPLNEYIESGILVNADITSALLINVFEHNTPLHDGAVIVRNNKLTAATCYLPLSDNSDINKDLGTRHRAGIGITEVTDALVVIVSEETGAISVAKDGKLMHDIDREQLSEELKKIQYKQPDKDTKQNKKRVDTISFQNFNLPLKIACLFTSFIVWVMVITNLNPVNTVTIKDIPITLINTNVIEDTGKTYEVIDNIKTIDAKIKDRKSVTDAITKDSIKVIADFNKLSYVNSIPLEYSFDGNSEITLSNSTIQISLEDIATTEVTLEVETVGESNDLYYVSDISLDYDTVVISGARSVINTIGRVVLNVDESKLSHNTILQLKPVIYDKNGEIINDEKLTLNRPEIKADIKLYKTKRVALNITPIIENTALNDIVTNIDYDNKQIVITGPDEILNSTSSIDISVPISIDLADITQAEYIKNIQLNNYITSEDLIVTSQYNRVNITLQFKDFYTKALELNKDNIIIEGLSENLTGSIKLETTPIDIISITKNIDNKTVNEIGPYIDASELKEGTYQMEVLYKDSTVKPYNKVQAEVIITKTEPRSD